MTRLPTHENLAKFIHYIPLLLRPPEDEKKYIGQGESDKNHRYFQLFFELDSMEQTNLKTLISHLYVTKKKVMSDNLVSSTPLRLSFALQFAKGLMALHNRGIIFRILELDDCFVIWLKFIYQIFFRLKKRLKS